MNKANVKMGFADGLNFDTVSISKANVNYVDMVGMKAIGMPFEEFDPMLASAMQFNRD